MLSSRTGTALSAAPERILSIQIMPQGRWTQPELSVGSPCSSLDVFGVYRCWMVKDKSPAHAVWKDLTKPIISLLDDQFEHLDAGDSDLIFEMFMIGRKPTSSVPTILFGSESKSCRQKAMALVEKKSILAAYPGVVMAGRSKMPKLLAQGEDSELLFLPSGVYLNGPLRTCGTSVLISFSPRRPPRIATIGGIVCIEEELYGVTAGHAFREVKVVSDHADDDVEFSFFGGSDPFDSSDDEDESVEMTSQASMSSGSSLSPDTNDFKLGGHRRKSLSSSLGSESTERSTLTRHSKTPIEDMRTKFGTRFASSDPDGSCDWALVKIEHPTLLEFPRTDEYMANNLNLGSKIIYPNSIATGSFDTDVLTCTGSGGVVQGRLSGVAAFKRAAGQKGFQQLLTMRLSTGSFHDGDCGSWVCDARTGAVYGHIVSGYPGTASAYLVPSDDIFQDMQQNLGKSVQLLTRTLAARNAALAIWGHIDIDDISKDHNVDDRGHSLKQVVKDLPRTVYVAQTEDGEKPISNLAQNTKTGLVLGRHTGENKQAAPGTGIMSSHYQGTTSSSLRPPTAAPPRKKKESSLDLSSDSGSGRISTSSASLFSARGKAPHRTSTYEALERQTVAVARRNSIKEGKLPEAIPSIPFGAELSGSEHTRGNNERVQSEIAGINASKAHVIAAAAAKQAKQDKQLEASTDTKVKLRKSSSLSQTKKTTKQPSSSHADKNSSIPALPIGRVISGNAITAARSQVLSASLLMMPQPMPLHLQTVSSARNRAMSYYASNTNSGYNAVAPGPLASAYGQPPRSILGQQSYPPAVPHQSGFQDAAPQQSQPHLPRVPGNSFGPTTGLDLYGQPTMEARPLSARFATPQGSKRERFREFLDDDIGYASAAESPLKQQNIPGPPRPNSALGTREYEMPSGLRRITSGPQMGNGPTMDPPVQVPSGRPNLYYGTPPRLPDTNQRSASYNLDRYDGDVRIEPAISTRRDGRIHSVVYDERRPDDSNFYEEKLRQATSYQEDVARLFTTPLTAESLRRTQRHRPPSSRETRSTRSSRHTISGDTRSTRSSRVTRSRSASSASSVTSIDESSSKQSDSHKARRVHDANEDVTIKLLGGARVMVGGTQIDCGDGGGQIVIGRMRSLLDNNEPPKDQTNYDFLRTENLRRRFERSISTPVDEKSNLSMVSGASDETIGKGNGNGNKSQTGGLSAPAAHYSGDSTRTFGC
ncbi:hypothetical protein BKA65DRAFT_511668 [Rhexocercosporidium sp. MPI-PUGE-AT-0058]|nr:hypothetical protein BKA65DRAFT_511668 [Rhexocercosporidium sp. MPI-PUGE-AT-0058]